MRSSALSVDGLRAQGRWMPRVLRPRVAAGVLVAALLLGLGWLWLRDSPLVSVDRVTVIGARGPDAVAIRRSLTSAARAMTTLNLDSGRLRTAVSAYPEVKGVQVSTAPPHGVRIRVIEQLPVAEVVVGGHTQAVAADGTLLHSTGAALALPTIPVSVPPGGPRLTEPAAVHAVQTLAAAPYRLVAKIAQMSSVSGHGLVAQLRHGPAIYLGSPSDLEAKWMAALAVLADPRSAGAAYIDVTDPGRPAAGAGPTASSTQSPASTAQAAAPAGQSSAATGQPSGSTAQPPGG